MRQNTVVGVYRSEQDAQGALDALRSAGFPRERIILNHEDYRGKYILDSFGRLMRSENAMPSGNEGDAGEKSFKSLVGDYEGKRSRAYAHAVNQGHLVLQLTVDSEDQADRASEIMDRFSPIDIDEYALSLNNPVAGMTDLPPHMQHGAMPASSGDVAGSSENRQGPGRAAGGIETMSGQARDDIQKGRPVDVRSHESMYPHAADTAFRDRSQEGRDSARDQGQILAGSAAGGIETMMGQAHDEIQKGRPKEDRMHESMYPNASGSPSAGQVDQSRGETSSDYPMQRSARSTYGGIETMVGQARDDVQKGRPRDQRRVKVYSREGTAGMQQSQQQTGRMAGDLHDDSHFRRHWQSTYGSSGGHYDDYVPGYRYGSYLAGNERYRGRQWNEIEPDIRNDWEASHQRGTWEKIKDAVRYGWENMTDQRDRQMGGSSDRQMSRRYGGYGDYDNSMSRRDWESRYASSGGRYEEYEPAYRYGSYLAGNERYRGRLWNEIEPDIRNDWEASHQRGTWERFKDAIRQGWESATGQGDRYARQTDDRYTRPIETGRSDVGVAGMDRPRQQSSGASMRGGAHIPEDADRRSEFQHSYWSSGGRSDDYAPAYRYGADFADNDTNPNHQWSDVEPRMRSDWQIYNREPGSWERNADAIRYGWERGRQHTRGTRSGHSLS